MTSLHPLTTVFNKFKNKEVEFSETDATLVELNQAVEDKGFKLRVLKQNSIRTDDFGRKDRVNAYVEEAPTKGKYRISSFDIG